MASELLIEDRRAKEAELLSIKGFMSMAELAEELGVSESTVRRDLEVLEDQKVIRRTHGGAVYVRDPLPHRLAYDEREASAVAEKEAIARAVADLIPPGQTVFLDGGTTCTHVARGLQGRRLNVVTNSVPIAMLLSADAGTEVTLIGGFVYPRTGVALGSMAEQMIETLQATQLVLSCAGVCPEGAFNTNQMMVAVERKMMAAAEETILAVDHTKLGRRSVAALCELSEIDAIVTDAGAGEADRRWLSERAARVIYADVEQVTR